MPPRLQNIMILSTEASSDSFVIPGGAETFDVRQGLRMVVAETFDHQAPLAVLSTDNGMLKVDPDANDGVFWLDISSAIAAAWPAGSYVYVLTGNEGGVPREICRGNFTISVGRTGLLYTAARLNLRESVTRSIEARRSSDLQLAWRVFDGGPKDLTGWSAKLTVRPTFDYPEPIASWATGNGLTVTSDGLVQFIGAQAGMAAFPPGGWTHLLVLSGGDGVFEVQRGPFNVLPGLP